MNVVVLGPVFVLLGGCCCVMALGVFCLVSVDVLGPVCM